LLLIAVDIAEVLRMLGHGGGDVVGRWLCCASLAKKTNTRFKNLLMTFALQFKTFKTYPAFW
jgi:hypothetical protein